MRRPDPFPDQSPRHLPQLPHTRHHSPPGVPPNPLPFHRDGVKIPQTGTVPRSPHQIPPDPSGFSPDRPEPFPAHKPLPRTFYCRDAVHSQAPKDRLRRSRSFFLSTAGYTHSVPSASRTRPSPALKARSRFPRPALHADMPSRTDGCTASTQYPEIPPYSDRSGTPR